MTLTSPMTARQWIDHLELERHPEGGWYKETYRSALQLPAEATDQQGPRAAATVIYFLLQHQERSHFHRIASDEHWFFHGGQALHIHVLQQDYTRLDLGLQQPQAWVPAGAWFAAELVVPEPEAFALVSCVVAPGFDFADFELAQASALQTEYPQQAALIQRLCL